MATMIKFRAWYMPFGKYGAMQEMLYSRASHILALAETEPEKYIPEQFTGLKDVNGKEIYEGDIVKVSYKYAQPKVSLVIREDGNSYIVGEDMATGNEMLVSDHIGEIEVIGNVHANPELLEADK
ncbi:YopX family protein [Lactiplantibacillus plantarum]|uniref:YopX family protein n=1 Tax=Lactiplantibacillus plantarum TaxID=1590 RepID=UPI002A74F856|nr:YopX family protein [Lactiplantibacillus plantarum]MDY2577339.1 YopX family protein [Lactiplantibacillus plantarum]